jgi:hypothetical protein
MTRKHVLVQRARSPPIIILNTPYGLEGRIGALEIDESYGKGVATESFSKFRFTSSADPSKQESP